MNVLLILTVSRGSKAFRGTLLVRFSLRDGPHARVTRLLTTAVQVDNRWVRAPRAEELWAAGCLQAALPGVVVGHHDRNLGAQHDFDLSHAGDVTFGAVEVTAAADSAYVELWKIVDGNMPWQDSGLAGGWKVYVRPGRKARNIKSLRAKLPPALQALEHAGRTVLHRHAPAGDLLHEAMQDLGVTWAYQAPTDFPGSIYVMPDLPADRASTFMADTGDALAAWIDAVMADPDQAHNLRKLAASAAPEKHLFLLVPAIVTTAPMPVTDVLMRGITPTRPPTLPAAVTHLWVTSDWRAGNGFRWDPTDGWLAFANDTTPLPVDQLAGCACS